MSRRSLPRGVLSLWTKTPMFRIRRGPLLINTLAVNLAARVFDEVHFVTDDRGAQIAETLGWNFDAVNCDLETWPCEGLDHIWALGKLVACAMQDRPFVQFDGDVLLFKSLPDRVRRARLIAQSPDLPHYYSSRDMRRALDIAQFPRGVTAFNAGLLGGRDVALARAFAWQSLEAAQNFRGCEINGTSTSMCIEQYGLGVFSKRVGVSVETLLPTYPTRAQVSRAGYAHLAGSAKYHPRYITRAEARLARDFPDAHAKFVEGWKQFAALADDEKFDARSSSSAPPFVHDF